MYVYLMRVIYHVQNMTLFEEGDAPEVTGNCLYVIFHGQVDVLVKGKMRRDEMI